MIAGRLSSREHSQSSRRMKMSSLADLEMKRMNLMTMHLQLQQRLHKKKRRHLQVIMEEVMME